MSSNTSSPKTLIDEANVSVLSLAKALGYNYVTFVKRLDEFDESRERIKEPYLQLIFDFLCYDHEGAKTPRLVSPLEVKIRYVIITEYIAKRPHDAIHADLNNKTIQSILKSVKELANMPNQTNAVTDWNAPTGTYKEVVHHCLAQCGLTVLKTKYNDKKYVAFTTKALHEQIRPGTHGRILWQNIHDPFFFTFCINPTYKHKGLVCELWLYEKDVNLNQWEKALNKVGLQCDMRAKNYIRCYSKSFEVSFKTLEKAVKDVFQNVLPEIEQKVLQAHELMKGAMHD